MDAGLRVLMSAYACEPGLGSEPGLGWNWCMQMARRHAVTVLVRACSRPAIERELARLPPGTPVPRFRFLELPHPWPRFRDRTGSTYLYYIRWQHAAHAAIAQLVREQPFDLLHHVTMGSFRCPTAIWGHGLPSIWGPVGGFELCPWPLLPWRYPRALVAELARNFANLLQTRPWSALRGRALRSSFTVVSTPASEALLNRLGCPSRRIPTLAVEPLQIPPRQVTLPSSPLRLLYVGRIESWKGVDLALHALAQSNTTACLTLIGEGPTRPAAQRLARGLGLGDRVTFTGPQPRTSVLQAYESHDVLCFPSLRDHWPMAILEAMVSRMPVIGLNVGGPGVMISDERGCRVEPGPRWQVIEALAQAIRRYDSDRALAIRQGNAAREFVLREHTWDIRGDCMHELYLETVRRVLRQ